MKTIICGGRDYYFTHHDYEQLDEILRVKNITEVISGGCTGADACGERWAKEKGIPVKRFLADWDKGKGAGPLRNEGMASYAEMCIVFPGGKGTADMKQRALAHGLFICEIEND